MAGNNKAAWCTLSKNVPSYLLIGSVLRLESKWWNFRASAVPGCHSILGTRQIPHPLSAESWCSVFYSLWSWTLAWLSTCHLDIWQRVRQILPSKCGQSVPTMTSSKRKSWLDTNVGSGIVHSAQIQRILSQVNQTEVYLGIMLIWSLASSDHTARLWEMSTGETVRQYNGHHKGKLDR